VTGVVAGPGRGRLVSGTAFRGVLALGGIAVSVLLVAIFLSLLIAARPGIAANGLRFFAGSAWDPVTNEFQALPFVVGTLVTSVVALVISTILSLALAVLMGEYFRRGVFSAVMRTAVELLAGIPSVVYGFIGLFFLVPIVRGLQSAVGALPFGVSIFTAAVLLAFMILPYSASLGREVISLVPADLKEAALSLGATSAETVRKVILPYARSGIMGGVLLSLGRALGETMAITMVIGNSNTPTLNVLAPGSTMASLIANEFSEATSEVYLASLIEIAALLFVVSTLINLFGKLVIQRMAPRV
jgi:phosphate transport system permease protein